MSGIESHFASQLRLLLAEMQGAGWGAEHEVPMYLRAALLALERMERKRGPDAR